MRYPALVRAALLLARWSLGAVFLYAGAIKVADPSGFAQAIAAYHLLPALLINLAAITLPWVEIVAGASLIVGLLPRGGAFIVTCLLLIFACALALTLVRGIDISCGCFSTDPEAGRITWGYLARDLALLGLGLGVLLADGPPHSTRASDI